LIVSKQKEKNPKMSVPNNLCHACHNFMKIEKIDDEYVLICPYCEKRKKKDEE